MPGSEIAYRAPAGLVWADGAIRSGERALLAVDETVRAVWERAAGADLGRLLADPTLQAQPELVLRAAAGLLVEAEVLTRVPALDPGPASAAAIPAGADAPLVSAIVLNRDGTAHLDACLSSLLAQGWPRLEVILVDNGSQDGSPAMVRQRYPQVRVIELGENTGFSAGNNHGAALAEGAYLFFINNDTEIAPHAICEMVRVAESGERVAAVAPKLKFFYQRAFLQGIGNSVRGRDWGSDNYIGFCDLGQFDGTAQVFSACFGAVLIDRQAWQQVGSLDERYLFYYEDADWSFRARAMGYQIAAAPRAVVYHKFGGSMETLPAAFKLRLVVRNRLRYALKNLEPGNAARFAAAYLLEDAANAAYRTLRERSLSAPATYAAAWLGLARSLPEVWRARRGIQARRATPDRSILPLAEGLPPTQVRGSVPVLSAANIVEHYIPFWQAGRARLIPEVEGVL